MPTITVPAAMAVINRYATDYGKDFSLRIKANSPDRVLVETVAEREVFKGILNSVLAELNDETRTRVLNSIASVRDALCFDPQKEVVSR